PVALQDVGYTVRNIATTIDVRANDSDPDGNLGTATIEIMSQPAQSQVTVDNSAGTITFTPPPNFLGADDVTYRLRDSVGWVSSAASVRVIVAHENQPRQNPLRALDVDLDGFIT